MASFNSNTPDKNRAGGLFFDQLYKKDKSGEREKHGCGHHPVPAEPPAELPTGPDNRLKEECLIALKVYDSCRTQECLTLDDIGYAKEGVDNGVPVTAPSTGDLVRPLPEAADVTIENLTLSKIQIVRKRPHELKKGYYTVDLRFCFEYTLVFTDEAGEFVQSVEAASVYSKKLTLFGSIDTSVATVSDMFGKGGGDLADMAGPMVNVEAKAVALGAKLHYGDVTVDILDDMDNVIGQRDEYRPVSVEVMIGLFFIAKLFRLVNLSVMSKGFCIPPECDYEPLKPCEFFYGADFPMDIFAPPQKPEFFAGISGSIPRGRGRGCE